MASGGGAGPAGAASAASANGAHGPAIGAREVASLAHA